MARTVGCENPVLRTAGRCGWPVLWLAIALQLPLSCTQEKTATPGDGDEAGCFTAATDAAGVAIVSHTNGEMLLEAEVYDSTGVPLAGLDVTYLAATPYPLVAFSQAGSGEPAGTFRLVPPTPLRAGASGEDELHRTAVFILNLLDPRVGRLYDPARDGFTPTRYTNLAEIRRVIGYEMIDLILSATPGLEDRGVRTRAQLAIDPLLGLYIMNFDRWFGESPDSATYITAHGWSRAALFARNQHGSYRYRFYRDVHGQRSYMIPLGVAALVTIAAPRNGDAFADPPQRQQILTGRVNLPPEVVTADGGRVELWANGQRLSGALAIGGDGTGDGTTFSTLSPLQLALGENTLRVVACVSEVNCGLQNGANGEAGEASVTVTYEEAPSGPSAPELSAFTHPSVFPCPDAQVRVDFHFRDADDDVVSAYELATWSFNGVPGSHEGVYAVNSQPALACFTQLEADCGFDLAYGGTNGGDWVHWEFYVVDAQGLESNHLVMVMNITGDCDEPRAAFGAEAWFAGAAASARP